jgi:hypothetical protein
MNGDTGSGARLAPLAIDAVLLAALAVVLVALLAVGTERADGDGPVVVVPPPAVTTPPTSSDATTSESAGETGTEQPGTSSDPSAAPATGDRTETDVRGSWTGTVTADDETDDAEDVELEIVSFDGVADGTMTTRTADQECSGDLAYSRTDGDSEIFTATDPSGRCFESTITVERWPDGTLYYIEEWKESDGTSRQFSGWLDPA